MIKLGITCYSEWMPAIFANCCKSQSAVLVWFLCHVDRIRLWPPNDNKKECFCHFFFPHFCLDSLCLAVKAIRAPQLKPPAARSALNVELDGARRDLGNLLGALQPSTSLRCCLFYSCHLPQQSSHHSFSELKAQNWNTKLLSLRVSHLEWHKFSFPISTEWMREKK